MIEWEKTTLSKAITGYYDGPHATPKPSDIGAIFLGIKNVTEDGRLDLTETRKISEAEYPKWTKRVTPKEGDIVLSYEATLHRYAMIPKGFRGCLGRRMALLRIDENYCDKYFFLKYMLSPLWRSEVERNILTGATVDRIPIANLPNFNIFLPPLPTQRKIAAILSAYDDLIENNLRRIKLLEEKAQLTYEEWFVRMKFPGHENTPIDEETGLPKGWETVKVGELLKKVKSTKKIKSSEILKIGNTPVIDQSRDFIKGYTNETEALIAVEDPLIVFGDHTRILKFINFNFARGADGTQLIHSNNKRMPQHLFYQVLKGIDLSDYHYARHFKYLKDSEINLPDKNTALEYKLLASPLYQGIKKLRDQNQLLKEARDILLPRLMTGMIDVEELDLSGFGLGEEPVLQAAEGKATYS